MLFPMAFVSWASRRCSRPQQQQGQARAPGRQLQSLAGLEVEPHSDCTCYGNRRSRAQGFFDGPQGLPLLPGLDQDHAGRIETQGIEAMAMRAAAVGEASP